ncbi:MAG: dTDP-4-dehydrorhamnose reductase [Verrucomicrobiales bacterium]|jgi:dTDP-4-dehydrorhamnose reductase
MQRIFLTGAGGQLGTDVVAQAAARVDVELISTTHAQLDITNAADVLDAVRGAKPDVIVHAAAYTAVDDCESNEALAFEVNGIGTANVVTAARAANARVIYVSTDYVFDGTKPLPYVEDDPPEPASVYGRSKLDGEIVVGELGERGLVVRTSWVCGANGSNMVKTILRAAEKYPQLTFVDDQRGKPTFTADLADALLTLAGRDDAGVMHVTNEGAVSWFEFCQDVLRLAGLDPGRVSPCSTDELQPPRPAPRPANSVLANTRFGEIGLPLLRNYRLPLEKTVRDLIS